MKAYVVINGYMFYKYLRICTKRNGSGEKLWKGMLHMRYIISESYNNGYKNTKKNPYRSHYQGCHVIGRRSRAEIVESVAEAVFTSCAFCSVLVVASMTLYMVANGLPAVFQVGLKEILLSSIWEPVAKEPSFGIGYVVLTSVAGTAMAVIIGVPPALLTAIFLAEVAPGKLAAVVRAAIELLAGIPSVIYGMIGMLILNPCIYRLERFIFAGSSGHRFTGGANLLSAVLVLAVMIMPTVINISETAIRAVPGQLKASSYALGASRVQTIFGVILPAAKPGIATAVVLGVGRALGEAMAVSLVSGGVVNVPLPFHSVRLLTTALVSEMGYAAGLHRQVLFTVGLVLFVFIVLVNLALNRILKEKEGQDG